MKLVKKSIWKGEKYSRKEDRSFRNRRTGLITKNSKVLGIERTKKHFYGSDPKKLRMRSELIVAQQIKKKRRRK